MVMIEEYMIISGVFIIINGGASYDVGGGW